MGEEVPFEPVFEQYQFKHSHKVLKNWGLMDDGSYKHTGFIL
jgi:hypothetical protein